MGIKKKKFISLVLVRFFSVSAFLSRSYSLDSIFFENYCNLIKLFTFWYYSINAHLLRVRTMVRASTCSFSRTSRPITMCCVFRPAKGCSACRSLVKINFLVLKQLFTSFFFKQFLDYNSPTHHW